MRLFARNVQHWLNRWGWKNVPWSTKKKTGSVINILAVNAMWLVNCKQSSNDSLRVVNWTHFACNLLNSIVNYLSLYY